MPGKLWKAAKRLALLIAIFLLAVLAIRAWESQRAAPLQPWHTFVPQEMSREAMEQADWAAYIAHEQQLFQSVESSMTEQLPASQRLATNRYNPQAAMHPARFAHDWNRSYVMQPAATPRGAVVMLHGLTDAPYSLRHVAKVYRDQGFVVIGLRLPAHGTVPGALTRVEWQDWMAATHLAVREARRRGGNDVPLHLVGYSNGGALAMKYALEALEDQQLARPDRLVLVSPMIGLTRFARFAGVAGWPSVFPAFAKAAWLDVMPEYNPFKYNSFPVNAARQSFLLADSLQVQVARLAKAGQLGGLPPVLTFQSVLDSTVSTPDVVNGLYAHLPANGSEIVLFDVNRSVKFSPLLQPGAYTALQRLLPTGPRRYRTTVVANAGPGQAAAVERVTEAGQVEAHEHGLGVDYPADIFSLSHIALPFPLDDALYGMHPGTEDDFGIQLGAVAPRGERGALVLNLNSVFRISSNPFMPYLLDRLQENITVEPTAPATTEATPGQAKPGGTQEPVAFPEESPPRQETQDP